MTHVLKVIQYMSNNTLMTSSIYVVNHKSISLIVAEIWQIDFFQDQFDLDQLFQGQPEINQFQFVLFTYSIDLSGQYSDIVYGF